MDKIRKDNGLDTEFEEFLELQNYKMMMELSAGIFHDFKNILANISGLTQLSMLEAETKELKSNLSNIYEATSQFKDALNRYQKLINGIHRIEKTPNDLNEILNKAISMVRFKFVERNKNSSIRLVANMQTEIKVFSNSYDLNQAFLNIIMNGIDAMEESGGTLSIYVYRIDELVCVSIKDTGEGISEDNLKKIFQEKFTTKSNGSGLGLKIAKATIEDHGGKIKIDSMEGRETEVRVYLPIYE